MAKVIFAIAFCMLTHSLLANEDLKVKLEKNEFLINGKALNKDLVSALRENLLGFSSKKGLIVGVVALEVANPDMATWEKLETFLSACTGNNVVNVKVNGIAYKFPLKSRATSKPPQEKLMKLLVIDGQKKIHFVKKLKKTTNKLSLSITPMTKISWVLEVMKIITAKKYSYYFQSMFEKRKSSKQQIVISEYLNPVKEKSSEAIIDDPRVVEDIEAKDDELVMKPKNLGDAISNFPKNFFDHGSIGGGHFEDKKKGLQVRSTVKSGLHWLVSNQHKDGRWDQDNSSVKGEQWNSIGLTGLSLLAFLDAGNTSKSGQYKGSVKKALNYLLSAQKKDGCFGTKKNAYLLNHIVATVAVTRAYSSVSDLLLRKNIKKAVDFIIAEQGLNDFRITVWLAMAFVVAKSIGLKIPQEVLSKTVEILQIKNNNPVEIAANKFVQLLLDPKFKQLYGRPTSFLLENLPKWDTNNQNVDLFYCYMGTYVMSKVKNVRWKNNLQFLVDKQKSSKKWPALGRWSKQKVYTTAMVVLTLQVYAE